MQDIDAPGEEVDESELPAINLGVIHNNTNNMPSSSALSELMTDNINGIKDSDSPDISDHVLAPGKEQPTPPTPPVSNSQTNVETVEPISQTSQLEEGGIPWYMKEFAPDGTSISNPTESGSGSGGLSADSLAAVGAEVTLNDVESTIPDSTPAKPKKGKSKKKARSRR